MSSLDVLLEAAHVKNLPAPTEATHGAMGDPMFGSFAIPDGGPQAQAFREAYVHALRDEGRPMSIVEAHTVTSPVIVDLDMRQTTPERIYTQKHIENFMDALVAATKYFVDQQHMDVVIREKPNPRLDKKHLGVYKDGIHVFMPNVITHPEIQLAIREHFVNDVTEHMAFASTICIPGLAEMDPGKIYDESVIKRGGRWFLDGSKKPDEAHPWKVTAWYQFDIAAGSFAKRDVQQMDLDTIVQNLSIRVHPKGGHSPYTKHGQEEMVIRGDENLSEPKKTFDSHHGMDVESFYNLVDILDAHRASRYDSWLKIGMALKNTVDTGSDTQRLEIWKAFAKKCPSKFCDTNHEKVWANLKPQKITLGTLCFLAKEDDPMGYAEWIRQWDTNDNKLGVKLDEDRIIKDLKVTLINLHIDNMILLDVAHDSIEFNMENGAKGAIHKNQYMVEVDDKYYGSLIDKFPIHEDPGFMKNVPSDKGPYKCELRTMDGKTISSAIVKSTDVQIALMNMGSESQYVNVQSITCNACKIRDKQVINTIHNMIFKAQESHAKNMDELDDFLRKLMPVDEERDVVLAFFAGLLSGRRKEKKFLAFTDKTSGDNGKSTLMVIFGSFFDEYGSSNGTKFLTKGSFARSRDDHDAGLKPMKGVRLLVAGEMKPNIALDEALIKRIAGGEGVRVCGRSCGAGNTFNFMWQAGVVMIFNKGDCPKFDGGDNAFVKRMVVVPMRSNFLIHPDPHREHEFERRDDLANILPTWRSALAQLLIEHFRRPGRSSIFDNLPVSMTDWKSGIADSANPLAEWLEEVIEVMGASSDAVWIGDLMNRWKESHYGHETSSVFSTKLVKAFFVGKQGTEWKESAQIEKKVKNGVIKGCKIVDEDAMLIPDVIKDNWYKGDYGLGQVAHFLLKGSVKKTGAGRGGYYIFEEYTCQWVKVDEGG
eukprot:gene1085-biopygen2458